MSTLYLNIGLLRGADQSSRITLDTVLRAIRGVGGPAVRQAKIDIELAQSDTGPTAVVTITGSDLTRHDLYSVARALDQDCIAFAHKHPLSTGEQGLVGPDCAKWGPFDAAKFIMPASKAAAPARMTRCPVCHTPDTPTGSCDCARKLAEQQQDSRPIPAGNGG